MDGVGGSWTSSEDRAAAVLLLSATDASSDARDLGVTDHSQCHPVHRPETALGQRPGNSVAANTLYMCLTLHNALTMLGRTIG